MRCPFNYLIDARQRKFAAAPFAIILALLALSGCEQQDGKADTQPVATVKARMLTLAASDVPSRYVTSGSVTSDHRVAISTRISGYVLDLDVREGDRVEKGQLLARIDPVEARQALIQAQADLNNAEAELRRYEELFREGAETKQKVERVRLRYKLAASQVKQASNRLSYSEIRSPVAGIVVEKRLSKGALAAPGAAILVLEDPTSLLVETHVSEQFVDGIHVGDTVAVEVAVRQRSLPGSVRQVVQAADAVSHQFLIKIALHEYDGIRPGMYARIGFVTGSRKALLVPEQAIIEQAGLHGIYIVDAQDRARYRQIRIGRVRDGKAEVLAGLHEGDVIAWQGERPLATGMQVQNR